MIDRIILINDLSQPKGGATALALQSALAFRARGLEVTFIAGDMADNAALGDAGVEQVGLGSARLHARGKVNAFVSGLHNGAATRLLTDWIARHDTPRSVYHLHGWAQILSPSVFMALRPVLARTVVHAHDFFLACPNGSYSFLKSGEICSLTPLSMSCISADCDRRHYAHKLWRVARTANLRRLCRPAAMPVVIAIHAKMVEYLVRAGYSAERVIVVPNPVRPYSANRITAEANHEFLFVGRIEETKGPDLAAEAARRAGVVLNLVGTGVLAERLQTEYPEHRFSGYVPNAGLLHHAARARALLMPSRYPEPYGLVAAEALWSGLPVIAAESAFLSGDIVAADAGFAVDPRDADGFAAALRTLADDDARVSDMSVAAFERTRSVGLEPDAWIDRLLAIYENRLASTFHAAA